MEYREQKITTQTSLCLLCGGLGQNEAPCDKACKKEIPVSSIIRSLRFENQAGARKRLEGKEDFCKDCHEKECLTICSRGKIDRAVNIPELMRLAAEDENPAQKSGKPEETSKKTAEKETAGKMEKRHSVLSVDFCGVHFENPFLLSSSIVGSNYEMTAKAFRLGWAGVAFKTIGMFVPEEVSPRFSTLKKEDNPFVGFKNIEQISDHPLEENITFIRQLKKDFPEKIILASIMGRNEEEWTYLAGRMEEAGADIIECNFSCPHMSGEGLGSDIGTQPDLVYKYTKAVRKGTKLPVLAKMTPNITNMELPALEAVKAGADGIAAINTIKSVVNIDLESFASAPDVNGKSAVGGYSGKAVKPIALRFIHDMKACEGLKAVPISGMGGIETWRDAAEFIAMGCETVQVTTAIMQYGYRIIDDLKEGLSLYMDKQGFQTIQDFAGLALKNLLPAEDLDRKSICYPKFDRRKCVSCGRCAVSCYDAGHQALALDEEGKPVMNARNCVGCHLCLTVCPVTAITPGTRVLPRT